MWKGEGRWARGLGTQGATQCCFLWASFSLTDPRLGAEEAPNLETPMLQAQKGPTEQFFLAEGAGERQPGETDNF